MRLAWLGSGYGHSHYMIKGLGSSLSVNAREVVRSASRMDRTQQNAPTAVDVSPIF